MNAPGASPPRWSPLAEVRPDRPPPSAAVLALAAEESVEDWAADAAVELARAWASEARPVRLVDLSIWTPRLHGRVGLEAGGGVTDVVLHGADAAGVARWVEAGLQVVPAGKRVWDPARVLGHDALADLLAPPEDGLTLFLLPLDLPGGERALRHADTVVLLASRQADPAFLLRDALPRAAAWWGPADGAAAAPERSVPPRVAPAAPTDAAAPDAPPSGASAADQATAMGQTPAADPPPGVPAVDQAPAEGPPPGVPVADQAPAEGPPRDGPVAKRRVTAAPGVEAPVAETAEAASRTARAPAADAAAGEVPDPRAPARDAAPLVPAPRAPEPEGAPREVPAPRAPAPEAPALAGTTPLLLEPRQAAAAGTTAARPPRPRDRDAPERWTVLLAEDNDDHALLVQMSLRWASSKPVLLYRARNGDEAIALLDSVAPDLLLLDLKMPGRTGHEVLDHVKGADRLRRIPVAVLTSSDRDEDVEKAYGLGGNHFLTKPDDPRKLQQQLRSLLDNLGDLRSIRRGRGVIEATAVTAVDPAALIRRRALSAAVGLAVLLALLALAWSVGLLG